MTTDLAMLLLAVVLAFAQLVAFAIIGNLEVGPRYTGGPRDEPMPPLSPLCGRLKRAYENHLETLPWFAIAVIVTHLAGRADAVTAGASIAYLAARVAYVPAYVSGVPYLRSAIWTVATAAILVIVIKALV